MTDNISQPWGELEQGQFNQLIREGTALICRHDRRIGISTVTVTSTGGIIERYDFTISFAICINITGWCRR